MMRSWLTWGDFTDSISTGVSQNMEPCLVAVVAEFRNLGGFDKHKI